MYNNLTAISTPPGTICAAYPTMNCTAGPAIPNNIFGTNGTGDGFQYSCLSGNRQDVLDTVVDDAFIREAFDYSGQQVQCVRCGLAGGVGQPSCGSETVG